MIILFKKFRQKLIAENQLSKYILYATGEIFLVVVGILLALQINSWNKERINKKEENYTLNRFKVDLYTDIEQLTLIIKKTRTQLMNLDTIVKVLEEKDNMPKFFSLQKNIHDINTFKSSQGTYDESISSGKLQLISNDYLRENIFNYYLDISRNNTDDAMIKLRNEIFLPYINNNIYNRKESIGFIFKTNAQLPNLDFDKLSNNKQYYGILISAKGRYVQILEWENYLRKAIELKKDIEKELAGL